MAISFIENSLVFDNATGANLTMFPSISPLAGDMLIAFIGGKAYNTTITPPSGWTSIGSSTNGTTASGVDTGSTKIEVFWKLASASEPSSYTFSLSASRTIFIGMIHVYRTTLNWNTPTGVGAEGSSWNNIVSDTSLSLLVNTYLPICFVSNTDNTSITTVPFLSASNRTLASYTAKPITNYSTSNGDAGGMVTGYSNVTAASSTIPTTLSLNSSGSASERGHAFIVQLTDSPPPGGIYDPFGTFGIFGI